MRLPFTAYSRASLRLVTDALRPDAGGSDAARFRARAETDWPAALALANAHYIAPALHAALSRVEDWPLLPEDLRGYLALLHGQNRIRNRRLRRQAGALVAAFNRAGIPLMLLKGGIALFRDHHGDPGARMIRDLDLLVPRADAAGALQVLDRLGHRAIMLYPVGHNAIGDFARDGDPAAIDLHVGLIDRPWLLPAVRVWRRAERIRVDEGELLLPCAEDRLLHNLLHGQIHHTGNFYRGWFELRQLLDFVRLAQQDRDAIDWPALEQRLVQQRLALPLQAWLLAADRLLGFDWPLATPPSAAARLQLRRCALQIRVPVLDSLTLPVANLCAAFARHRMDGLYGARSPLLLRQLRHALQFLHKSGGSATMARLFKTQ